MNKLFYLLLTAATFFAIIGLAAQGCAKSGDGTAASADSEPEFTITGEAI